MDADFDKATITISTTEMEDCKTPSSGYCGISSDLPNVAKSVTNYQASISATLTAPAFYAPPKGICNQFPEGYCSWNIGIDGQGGPSSYCGKSKGACELCGGRKWWCSCSGGVLSGCELLQSQ